MVELLVAVSQGLCIFGLLGGAYVAILLGEKPIPIARAERYDPVTAHSWTPANRSRRDARG